MAHLYVMLRGMIQHIEAWKTRLQGQNLPCTWYNKKTKKVEPGIVEIQVRAIELLEIVYPQESQDLILNSVLDKDLKGITQHKRHKPFIYALRKMLGVKPIPKYEQKAYIPLHPEGMEIIGIGVKEDRTIDVDGDGKKLVEGL